LRVRPASAIWDHVSGPKQVSAGDASFVFSTGRFIDYIRENAPCEFRFLAAMQVESSVRPPSIGDVCGHAFQTNY